MKQNVNLLRAELKPTVQRITLPRVVAIGLALMVLSSLGWAYTAWLNDGSQQTLKTVNQRLEQTQQQQQQLQQQLDDRQPSQQLLERSEQLDEQISAQRQLNQRLEGQKPEQLTLPDRLMAELYAVDIEGLWLTEFSSSRAGVSLTGKAIQANLLPRWMRRFQQQQLLARSRFAVVDLDNDEQGYQTFSLSNTLASESDSSGDASGAPEQEGQ
ncbi:PilN domain-containing protein [Idiomarina seosinensis]|uniref:PilN domain-containing protein n=1 Tax=Idiomarina seosinensis TaxID=281739 RepID=UPI00384C4CBF